MQYARRYYNDLIYSAEIRDTGSKTTAIAEISGYERKGLFVQNNLNQNVAIQIQGSADKVNFANVGIATTVNAAASSIIGTNEVAQLNNYFPYLRATITAAISPTTGTITIYSVAV